jgi:hypothetical protein
MPHPKLSVEVPCTLCGTPVSRPPSQLVYSNGTFCSTCWRTRRSECIGARLREVALARLPRPRSEEFKKRMRETLGTKRRKSVTKQCDLDGCTVMITRRSSSMTTRRIYCCPEHRSEGLRKHPRTLVCDGCKKSFPLVDSSNYKRSKQHFCSIECANNAPRPHREIFDWKPEPAVAGYCAGIIDGEGYVSIAKSGHGHAKIVIANTNRLMLDFISQQFPGASYLLASHARKAHHKPWFRLEINGNHAVSFLRGILPYLVIKKEQANIAITFHLLKSPRRLSTPQGKSLLESLRILNHRGVPLGQLQLI